MIAKIGNILVEISEVPDLKNSAGSRVLGLSWTGKKTGWIKIQADLKLPEFWDYIKGKCQGSICSVQKKAVMQLLGLTKETLGTVINSPARAKEFLLRHELSHIRHLDSANQRLNRSGRLSLYRIAIEARATYEAWLEMLKKYGKV
jgi:hypothetical protein